MEVKECMSKNPELIPPETSIGEAAKKMSECNIGALFVYNQDRLIGVVTDRDLVTRATAKGLTLETPVKDVMTPKVLYCFDDESLDSVAENFARNQVRRLAVLDCNKRLVGVVSLGDITGKS